MDLKRILFYTVLLIAGLGLGYAIGKAQPAKKLDQAAKKTSPPDEIDLTRETANTIANPTIDSSTVDSLPESPPSTPEPALSDSNGEETLIADRGQAVSALPSSDLCFKPGSDELKTTLLVYTQQLESQSLPYNNQEPEKLLDCSGIFHRISQFVSTKCDAYNYPDVRNTRDTRALAGWFHDNDNLVIIHDAAKQRNLIKPGTVMFFGKSGQSYNNLTIDRLKTPIPNHVIMHVGVVTDVKKDDKGDVINYTMFHGRSPGKIASSTYYHNLKPPRTGFPPLGNWNQQLVAVANIMTPK